eukprot:g37577.t1
MSRTFFSQLTRTQSSSYFLLDSANPISNGGTEPLLVTDNVVSHPQYILCPCTLRVRLLLVCLRRDGLGDPEEVLELELRELLELPERLEAEDELDPLLEAEVELDPELELELEIYVQQYYFCRAQLSDLSHVYCPQQRESRRKREGSLG